MLWRGEALTRVPSPHPHPQVYERIATAFVEAGLPEHATSFYAMSGQELRLTDRTKPWQYDFPDLFTIVSVEGRGRGGGIPVVVR
jgi:hypothetical protein